MSITRRRHGSTKSLASRSREPDVGTPFVSDSTSTRSSWRDCGPDGARGNDARLCGTSDGVVPMIPKITLTDAPTPEMRKAIVEPLVEFNHSRIGKPETYRPLAILLSQPESDEILGGLYGVTAFSYLHVDLLFVTESMPCICSVLELIT